MGGKLRFIDVFYELFSMTRELHLRHTKIPGHWTERRVRVPPDVTPPPPLLPAHGVNNLSKVHGGIVAIVAITVTVLNT